MVRPSGLCSKFISVPPTQSLALSWEHGRAAIKASYRREGGREDQGFALHLLVLSLWGSSNLFQRHEGTGSVCLLYQVSWEMTTAASTG